MEVTKDNWRYGEVIDGKFYVSCDPDGLLYLPENLAIPGDLILPDEGIYDLPANLTVEGDLNLAGTCVCTVGPNLTVEGTLTLTRSYIKKLPNNVHTGSLIIENSELEVIEKDLTVRSDLDLNGTNIIKIGPHLSIGGTLTLTGSHLKKLPDNVKVGRLILDNSELEEIGCYLTVRDDLDLEGSEVISIGSNLTVRGTLYIGESKIRKLPEFINVNKIYISYGELEELPAHLTVKYDLDIKNTNIKKLGEYTNINGSFDLSNTQISSLPSNLYVGGSNYNLSNINKKSQLIIKNTSIKFLPDNLYVEELHLENTKIESFGKDITIKSFYLDDKILKGNPRELEVNKLYVDGNNQDAINFALSIKPEIALIIKNGISRLPKHFPDSCSLIIVDNYEDHRPAYSHVDFCE